MTDYSSCLSKQKKLKESFATCKTNEEKYSKIIQLGNTLTTFHDEWKRPDNLVKGCQSVMYLHSEFIEGKGYFWIGSEALISKGLGALLLEIYNGESPETIIKCPPDIIKELGLESNLTPSRVNGLSSLLQMIRYRCLIYLSKSYK